MDHTPRAAGHVPMERSSRNRELQFLAADHEPNLSLSSFATDWLGEAPVASAMDWSSLCYAPSSLTSMYGFGAGAIESSSPVQTPWASAWSLVDPDIIESPSHALTSHSPFLITDEPELSPFSSSYTDETSRIWSLAGLDDPAIDDQVLIRGSHPPVGGPNPTGTGDTLSSDFDLFPMAAGPSAAPPLLSSWTGAFHFISGLGSGRGEFSQSRPQEEISTRSRGGGGGREDRMDLDNGTRAVQGQTPIRLEHQNAQARPAVHTAAPTRVRSPVSAPPRSHEWYNRQRGPDGLYYCPAVWCSDREGKRFRVDYYEHIDTHVSPFRCQVYGCGNPTFGDEAKLLRHNRVRHNDSRNFRCPIEGCGRGQRPFSRRWNLADHLKRVHDIDEMTPPADVPDQPTRDRVQAMPERVQSMPEPPSRPQPSRRPRRRRSVDQQGSRSETPSRTFSCPMPDCSATFRREWNVENHLVTVHHIDGPHPSASISPPSPTRHQGRPASPPGLPRAGQTAQTNGRSRYSALRVAELERQLATFRPTPSATTTATTAPAKPEPPKAKRKSVHMDTECPICCELLWNGEDERLSWCKAQCGQNFHAACWGIWEKEQKRRAKKAKCAMCRTEWVG